MNFGAGNQFRMLSLLESMSQVIFRIRWVCELLNLIIHPLWLILNLILCYVGACFALVQAQTNVFHRLLIFWRRQALFPTSVQHQTTQVPGIDLADISLIEMSINQAVTQLQALSSIIFILSYSPFLITPLGSFNNRTYFLV